MWKQHTRKLRENTIMAANITRLKWNSRMFWLIKLNALRTAKASGVSGLTIFIIVLHYRVFMAQVINLSSYILLLLLNGRSCEC